jgi:predicted nuclease with TOPRIM domain
LSGFGPASDLAKRLRESRQRLARIASDIEAGNAKLPEIQQELLKLQEKRSQAKESDVQLQIELESQLQSMESTRIVTEDEIRRLKAEQKLVGAELAEAKHEQQVIIQILQAKFSAAVRQLESKQASKERTEHNHKLGLLSLETLSQAEQTVAAAESELDQLKLLLEFYSNIGNVDAE